MQQKLVYDIRSKGTNLSDQSYPFSHHSMWPVCYTCILYAKCDLYALHAMVRVRIRRLGKGKGKYISWLPVDLLRPAPDKGWVDCSWRGQHPAQVKCAGYHPLCLCHTPSLPHSNPFHTSLPMYLDQRAFLATPLCCWWWLVLRTAGALFARAIKQIELRRSAADVYLSWCFSKVGLCHIFEWKACLRNKKSDLFPSLSSSLNCHPHQNICTCFEYLCNLGETTGCFQTQNNDALCKVPFKSNARKSYCKSTFVRLDTFYGASALHFHTQSTKIWDILREHLFWSERWRPHKELVLST